MLQVLSLCYILAPPTWFQSQAKKEPQQQDILPNLKHNESTQTKNKGISTSQQSITLPKS